MLGSRTDLHIFDAGSVNGTRYCNEILLPYVRLFRGAMGLQFLFMDDNAPCHRTVAAEQLLQSEDIERMDWPARSPDLNPIEHNYHTHLEEEYANYRKPPVGADTFHCNNCIVIAQRKHLDDFLRGRIIGRLDCGRTQLDVSEDFRIAQSVISRLWKRFQDDDNRQVPVTTKRLPLNDTVTGGAGWLVWGGIIIGSRTDLNVQRVTMTSHIFRDVIPEQHVRLLLGAMGAEFLFIGDNTRPHRTNIVDECLQFEDITRMNWPA
ncbi:transposable element Tc3 transposase [Trichonephila clavipes]|nr:transposable element Tc3 transposase [Trichonephila clavipes]